MADDPAHHTGQCCPHKQRSPPWSQGPDSAKSWRSVNNGSQARCPKGHSPDPRGNASLWGQPAAGLSPNCLFHKEKKKSKQPSTPRPHAVSVSRCRSISSRWRNDAWVGLSAVAAAGRAAQGGLAQPRAKPGRDAATKKGHFCKSPGLGLRKEGRGIQKLHYLLPSSYVLSYILETVLSSRKLVASGAAEVEAQRLAEAESCSSFCPCRGGE